MRPLRHMLEYVLFSLASGIVQLLPLRTAGRLGGWLGERVLTLLHFRRDIVVENLRFGLPELPENELRSIARESFRSVGTTLFELLWYPSLDADRLKAITTITGHDLFKRAREEERGILLLTAHFGNWEFVPQAMTVHYGISFRILYKPQSNRLIDKDVAKRRTQFGNVVIPMGIAVRELLKALRNGENVVMAADQSAPRESIHLSFFGREVPVFQGPASLVLKTGAALIIALAVRQEDGTYHIQCREIPSRDLQDTEEGVRELTKRHVRETESMIRLYPGQWMWMHRRWKHAEERGQAE